MHITIPQLAEAVAFHLQDGTLEDLKNSKVVNFYKTENCFFEQVCRRILSNAGFDNPHKKTLQAHTAICYRLFHRKFESLAFYIDNLMEMNYPTPCNITGEDIIIDCPVTDEKNLFENVEDTAFDNISEDVYYGIIETLNPKVQENDIVIHEDCSKVTTNSEIDDYGGETITIPKKFWEKFWSSKKSLFQGWTDDFYELFREKYPFCVLSFIYHKCYETKVRNETYFIATAQCKNSSCATFKFYSLTPILAPYCDIELIVEKDKKVHHENVENHRRFIKGDKRCNLQNLLRIERPSTIKLQKLGAASSEILESGNLYDAPSSVVLQKISSDINSAHDLDKDFVVYLLKLKDLYDTKWPHNIFSGYFRALSIYPFYIILYTARQIEYLLSLKGPVFLHLDATGSVIANVPGVVNRPFYYALSLSGKTRSYGPLPIGEFISTVHSTYYLSIFLGAVNDSILKLSSRKSVVHKIETDFSLALIQGSLLGFNAMSLKDYLNMTYKIITERPDEHLNFTVIHICSTHLIGTIRRKIKSCSNDKTARKVALHLAANLLHCTTMEEAAKIFRDGCIIFGCEWDCEDLKTSIDNVLKSEGEKTFLNLNNNDNDKNDLNDDEENKDGTIFEDDMEAATTTTITDGQKLRHGSPFYNFFHDIFLTVYNKPVTYLNPKKNPFCNMKFLEYLVEHILPFFPLWSAIILSRIQSCKIKFLRYSNATAETWFHIVKNIIFKSQKRIPIPRFISILEENLLGRIRERMFSLDTERQKKKRTNIEDVWPLAEESWDRKKGRVYFTQPKIQRIRNIAKNIVDNNLKREANKDKISAVEDDAVGKIEITNTSVTGSFREDYGDKGTSDRENVKDNEEIVLDAYNATESFKKLFSPSLKYPEHFPNLSRTMYGIILDQRSFSTLELNNQLDDNIINASFMYFQDLARLNQFKVLCFETFFSSEFVQFGKLRRGFRTWSETIKISDFDVWLIPVHYANHWTLLVIVPVHKIFLYIDTLNLPIPPRLIDGFKELVIRYCGTTDFPIDWAEWNLVRPRDIPQQNIDGAKSVNNCGVHIITWGHIIVTSSYHPFSENNMIAARKGIACMLEKSKNIERRKTATSHLRGLLFEEDDEHSTTICTSDMEVTYDPPLGSESTFEYAASLKYLIQLKEHHYQTRSKR